MNTSNIQMVCCISKENTDLKLVINEQSNTIGLLLQEKEAIKIQYDNLLNYVSSNMSNIYSSNI